MWRQLGGDAGLTAPESAKRAEGGVEACDGGGSVRTVRYGGGGGAGQQEVI